MPAGPQCLEPRCADSLERARVGALMITGNDYVVRRFRRGDILPETKHYERSLRWITERMPRP